MKRNLPIEGLIRYVESEACDFSVPQNQALVHMTRDSYKLANFHDYYQMNQIPVSETPGGITIVGYIESLRLSESDARAIWEVAEDRYISLAKGRVNVLAEEGEKPSQRFITKLLPKLLANPNVMFVGPLEISKVKELYQSEKSEYKYDTARVLTEIANGKLRPENLLVPTDELNRVRENFRNQVLIETVDRIIEPSFLELSTKREEILIREKAKFYQTENTLRRRQLRLFKNSPFYKIRDFLEDRRLNREIAKIYKDLRRTERLIENEVKRARSGKNIVSLFNEMNQQIVLRLGPDKTFSPHQEIKNALQARVERIIEHHRESKGLPVKALKEVEGVSRGIKRGM